MKISLLLLTLSFLSFSALGNGRAPAVEDFVGIEVDHVESTPQGTESLYNLESDLKKVGDSGSQTAPVVASQKEFMWDGLTVTAVGFLAILPMFACLFFMRRLRKKASVESASNIEVLEKYRKEREARKNQDKTQEHKKAS